MLLAEGIQNNKSLSLLTHQKIDNYNRYEYHLFHININYEDLIVI
jgi:hypothetical protein